METSIILPHDEFNAKFRGFVKIWRVHKKTGEKELVVDKQNTILNMGASLLASLLAGATGAGISLFYIGFNNNLSFTYPNIDVTYSQPFNQLSIPAGFGYLRLPLSFPASFISGSGLTNNTVVFSTVVASASAFYGNAFTSDTSQIYEIALVSNTTGNASDDQVFARINFPQIEYDSSFALSINWGVTFITT